jgi:hypothetical protein
LSAFDEIHEARHDAYFETVGVITNFRNQGLQEPPMPEMFLPYTLLINDVAAFFSENQGRSQVIANQSAARGLGCGWRIVTGEPILPVIALRK